ncbi:MAG: helix-turn-helix transcriptional regulator [Peptococcaceae bacterium]|nr:helix-turn-helix transcriptional regulator [Peptococcaceae bacterium]
MHLGNKLVQLRKRWGLSQAALARKAGVAQSTVSDIEGGHIDPKVSTVVKLLRVLTGAYEMREWESVLFLEVDGWKIDPVMDEIVDCLTVIKGRAEMMLETLESGGMDKNMDQLLQHLQTVVAETERLHVLVRRAEERESGAVVPRTDNETKETDLIYLIR